MKMRRTLLLTCIMLNNLPISFGWIAPAMTTPLKRTNMPSRTIRVAEPQKLSTVASPNDNEDPNNDRSRLLSARNLSVGAILASSFLNLLSYTLISPITPQLGNHFKLTIGTSFGSLSSAYPLGMLFGLFIWPQLSDRIGRKPVMTASLFGSGIGLAAQAFVIHRNGSMGLYLAIRALTGAFAGSSPISKAYLADIGYRNGMLPRYLALRDAASTMAFIVGPMMGGIIYDIRRRMLAVESTIATTEVLKMAGSLSFVMGVAAATSLTAALLVGAFVQELEPNKKKKKPKTDEDSTSLEIDEEVDEELVACPLGKEMWTGVASVCVVSFLFNVGDSTFHAFFSALLRQRAGLGAQDIGLLYTMLACISFTVSATSSSGILKRYGPVVACATGMSFIGSGLIGLGLAASSGVLAIPPTFSVLAASAAIYYMGVPIYGPAVPTMLLRCVPSHRRGAIMGLDGAINTIARVISPLLMGELYRRYGAGAAFGCAGVAVLGGVATTLFRRYVVLQGTYANDTRRT
jgi:DHA1 family tetracycline resistance protein-like MFS transporter